MSELLPADEDESGPFQRGWALFLLGVVAFGVGLRWWRLGELPLGVYQDEAVHGLDALAGVWRWYYPANNGREPLFVWLVTLAVGVLGPTALALRLPAALLGTLTIPAAGLLGAKLLGRRAGWLAAAVTAVTFWPLALSRVSFRAGALPLLLALSAAAGWSGVRERRWRLALLGGVLYGLSFYTYSAARFTPLVLVVWGGWAWWLHRRDALPWRELLAFGLATLVAGAPLIWLAVSDTALVMGRLGQVGVSEPGMLLRQTLAGLLMFNWAGDTIGRHNLIGRPVFDLLLGLAFLVGLGQLGRRARGGHLASGLLLAWALGMLGPSVLAEDAPHFLRAVGVLPAALVVAAVGLQVVWQWLGPRRGAGLVAGVLILSAGLTTGDYFGRYASSEETGVWFQQAATTLAADVLGDPAAVWIDRRLWDTFPSVRYLLAGRADVAVYDEQAEGWPGPDGGQLVVWPYEDFGHLLAAVPPRMVLGREGGALYREERSSETYTLYTRFTVRAGPMPESLAQFGPALRLLAAEWQWDGADIRVRQQWQAVEMAATDYHIFVHVLAPDGQTVAVADGQPLDGDWPFSRWEVGTVVEHETAITLPDEFTGMQLALYTGLYDPATNARVMYHTAAGESGDRWAVTPVE